MVYITLKHNLTFLLSLFYFSQSTAQALDKSKNCAIITNMPFLKNMPVFAKHSLYLYGLYYTETQSNILIIIILLQPEYSPMFAHAKSLCYTPSVR